MLKNLFKKITATGGPLLSGGPRGASSSVQRRDAGSPKVVLKQQVFVIQALPRHDPAGLGPFRVSDVGKCFSSASPSCMDHLAPGFHWRDACPQGPSPTSPCTWALPVHSTCCSTIAPFQRSHLRHCTLPPKDYFPPMMAFNRPFFFLQEPIRLWDLDSIQASLCALWSSGSHLRRGQQQIFPHIGKDGLWVKKTPPPNWL